MLNMPDMPNIVYSILETLIIIISALVLIRAGKFVIKRLLKRVLHLAEFYPTIGGLWKTFIIIFAICVFLKVVLNIGASSLLTAVGISSLTIGIASQNILKDLLMGIFILIRHSFQIGDIITTKGITGRVDKIGIQATRLVDLENGTLHIINNSEMSVISIHPAEADDQLEFEPEADATH